MGSPQLNPICRSALGMCRINRESGRTLPVFLFGNNRKSEWKNGVRLPEYYYGKHRNIMSDKLSVTNSFVSQTLYLLNLSDFLHFRTE